MCDKQKEEMERLFESFIKKLAITNTSFVRSLMNEIEWKARLCLLYTSNLKKITAMLKRLKSVSMLLFLMGASTGAAYAVSYTHLDVYKRQFLWSGTYNTKYRTSLV